MTKLSTFLEKLFGGKFHRKLKGFAKPEARKSVPKFTERVPKVRKSVSKFTERVQRSRKSAESVQVLGGETWGSLAYECRTDAPDDVVLNPFTSAEMDSLYNALYDQNAELARDVIWSPSLLRTTYPNLGPATMAFAKEIHVYIGNFMPFKDRSKILGKILHMKKTLRRYGR